MSDLTLVTKRRNRPTHVPTVRATSGRRSGPITINPTTGVLAFITAPDFENPGDANADNDYEVQVTVTDSGGLTDVQDITVTVTDAAENVAPTITSAAAVSVVGAGVSLRTFTPPPNGAGGGKAMAHI